MGVKDMHNFSTEFGDYELHDVTYNGRKARVLYSGNRSAAQSGIALDGKNEMLFDYNERFMELARGLRPNSVLLIGGGSFTLPAALLRQKPDLELDVVEPDAQLETIGKRYFGYQPGTNTRSHAMGGAAYLEQCRRTYDMVIIDAFVHDEVPAELQTAETTQQLRRVLKPGGMLAMNIISASLGRRSALLERQQEALAGVFGDVEIFPAGAGTSEWIPQNYLLCAGSGNPGKYLRYPAIKHRTPFSDIFAPETDSTA
jgi:spermidine synthase